ncbi:thioredoxin domain protein (macronuclear) [Tetrahymena thermophila SB210]|uniref:Thioredoxin domain protein n=1 Tax=Tetrahymena thermophila (strain SB210) TaxID=312017 RepID=I7MEI6_TETTS|nr:thioredoxin domain protein [Tetrahymena thermophila SB210]EAR96425.2 thioredoxin domain protein [Tetrahymena thermophila SB210]|eukprot:XP_001016670.2 thioredoxin domain protein [Tetrahymena thermophila SB210]
MKSTSFLLGFLLLLASVLSKAPIFGEDSAIVMLDQSNFDKVTQGFKDKSWVLLFYAPWCPHCNDIQSVYESLQKKHQDKFTFAQIDSEKSLEIKERFGVSQFPTILVVDHQTQLYHKYRGTRQEDIIELFLTKNYKEFPGIDLPSRPSLFKTLKNYYEQVGTPIVIGGIAVASILLIFTLVDLVKGEKKEKIDLNELQKESEEKEQKSQQNNKKQNQQKKQKKDEKSSSSQQDKKKQKDKKDQ